MHPVAAAALPVSAVLVLVVLVVPVFVVMGVTVVAVMSPLLAITALVIAPYVVVPMGVCAFCAAFIIFFTFVQKVHFVWTLFLCVPGAVGAWWCPVKVQRILAHVILKGMGMWQRLWDSLCPLLGPVLSISDGLYHFYSFSISDIKGTVLWTLIAVVHLLIYIKDTVLSLALRPFDDTLGQIEDKIRKIEQGRR